MNLLTVVYVGLVAVGIAWVTYRLRAYMSEQKDRESSWADMASEDQFRSYLKELTETTSTNGQDKKEKSGDGGPPRSLPHPKRRDKKEGTTRKE